MAHHIFRGIAQLVEQRSPKPRAEGSSPSAPAKKAPIFRCFFPLFTPFYGDFTCFSHIDKTTAHGLFRTPFFHFCTVFCSLCPHNPRNPFGTSSKKHQSQFKFIRNTHQHIRVSFNIIHFGYLRYCVSK